MTVSGRGQLLKHRVAVEKLFSTKFAKIKLRQEALQSIFSGRLDIFYPPILAVWDEKRVFQQPLAIALIDRGSVRVFPSTRTLDMKAAEILQVRRATLSDLLHGKSGLTPEMALRIEKAFGPDMDHLLRMQLAYDVAKTREHARGISIKRYARA